MTTYGRRPGVGRHSVNSYATVGLQTEVFSATPEELITLLIDGARTSVIKAKLHLENGEISQRGEAISKAIDIVDSGLKGSVDKEKGGEVAIQLIANYDLIIYHLMQANLHSDVKGLNIAQEMLQSLGDTWKEATKQA